MIRHFSNRFVMLPTALIGVGILAGCVDPSNYETAPVQVQTSQGVVTCQLYTKDRVTWDRAIDRPETMSVKDADQYCINEGIRRQKAG